MVRKKKKKTNKQTERKKEQKVRRMFGYALQMHPQHPVDTFPSGTKTGNAGREQIRKKKKKKKQKGREMGRESKSAGTRGMNLRQLFVMHNTFRPFSFTRLRGDKLIFLYHLHSPA
jgi:hypothetical protein